MVGDDVVVEVIEISGSNVRIGITAPRSVPVFREEIWTAAHTRLSGIRANLLKVTGGQIGRRARDIASRPKFVTACDRLGGRDLCRES